MKKTFLLLFISFITAALYSQSTLNDSLNSFNFNPDINKLRTLSNSVEGELPIQINVEKIAETIRPASVVVKDEDPNKNMTLSRTVYQIEYKDRNIMLDSGMDYETHRTFGKTEEPYFPDKFELVEKALLNSDLIILTHYHADHVGGVVRSKNFDLLAKKTWLTKSTAELMLNKPHKNTVVISEEKIEQFQVEPDKEYIAIAPGVVLFMAPGHTPDSKMIYIKLANGTEYIHSVDSGWSMENIREERMKNASWVSENEEQLLAQYKWLNSLQKTDPDIIVLSSHDNVQYQNFTTNGILGNGLKTD